METQEAVTGDWKRIAVVGSMEFAYGRGVARGVSSYVHPDKRWSLRFLPLYRANLGPALRDWQPHGVVGHIPTEGEAWAVFDQGCPFVNCSERRWRSESTVTVDNAAVGRVAAEILLSRNLVSYAFYGSAMPFAEDRQRAFCDRVAAEGHQPSVHLDLDPYIPGAWEGTGEREAKLRRWLEGLPKPTGLFVATDQMALRVAENCRSWGLEIPSAISLVGADNDEIICEMVQPRLTTISIPARRIGYEAAAILDRLLGGEGKCDPIHLRLDPGGVVERESSGAWETRDPVIRRSLQYIQENAARMIGVDDLARAAGVSRRVLERKFGSALRSSPRREIERVRLRWACELLSGSDLSVAAVAEKCGFGDHSRFTQVFRQYHGLAPLAWRRRHPKAGWAAEP